MNNRDDDKVVIFQHPANSNSDKGSDKSDKYNITIGDQTPLDVLDDNLSRDCARQAEPPLDRTTLIIEGTKQRMQDYGDQTHAGLKNIQGKLGFSGDPMQLAQQNALSVLAAQLIASTFLSLLISQITPLQFIWELIPILDIMSVATFLMCLIILQFFKFLLSAPFNLIFFVLHTVSKIFLLTYVGIWYEDLKIEIILVGIIFLVGYMIFNIYESTQNGTEANFTIKQNILKLIIYSSSVSLFLVLFTRSSFWIWLTLNIISLLYGFFLLISLQRFPEHQYLLDQPNDFYLGAGQLDADLLFPFSFIRYFFMGIKNQNEIQ